MKKIRKIRILDLCIKLVSPGAVTDGVTLFFVEKLTTCFVIVLRSDDLFLVIVTTFTLSAFQAIVSPVFFVNSATFIYFI